MNTIPRPEYPRPQFVRKEWMNLNGCWQFEIDHGLSGRSNGILHRDLNQCITVPFCPESRLSGINYTDFMAAVWYRRTFTLPDESKGKRILLHFGAVDYHTEVWINDKSVGEHFGGYASFCFEITDVLKSGENTIVVCAEDNTRSERQPAGKQSHRYESVGCNYTRTTGIWQTVWLEWVPQAYIENIKYIPDVDNGSIHITAKVNGSSCGMILTSEVTFNGNYMGSASAKVNAGHVSLSVALSEKHLWTVGQPNLYDIELKLVNETSIDTINSYFALRTVEIKDKLFLINGKPVFQRLVLDQGYYPDGVYTAPTDNDLKSDILRSMAMGFNGARLHQKVFEPRYLYWADKLGYICWGEMASWGCDPSRPQNLGIFLREWIEVINRDFSAPCIILWCPYNEVWRESNEGMRELTVQVVYRITKELDPYRPVIDASGGFHMETDIYDTHDYEQDHHIFCERYRPGAELYDNFNRQQHYNGGPIFISEYGGIQWTQDKNAWGYGKAPESPEAFIERYKGLTTALLNNPEHIGFCYTQLTDVEQEQNGLYTYDRQAKFSPDIIAAINRQVAAIENEENSL